MKRIIGVAAVLLVLALAWLAPQVMRRPALGPYAERMLPAAEPAAGALRVRFLGVSTLLFEDGETAFLTDGFFTRPGPRQVLFGRVEPDRELIAQHLRQAGIERLAAVIVLHSHYDHAMDAPEVARRTGALLVGSASTANIGRGLGLAEERMRVVGDGESLRLGRFTITFVDTPHSPVSARLGGHIERPLVPPARVTDYKEGGSFSLLVEHDGRSALVQGSAGFREGALQGRRADVVFLGVGALGKEDDAYRQGYWRHVVRATGARRVVPIHWDDFTRPLSEPLAAFPYLVDDFAATMRFLERQGRADGVAIALAPLWRRIDPFAGF